MDDLICPVCKEKLIKNEKKFSCKKGHSFDMGKQGYINLHLSNKKSSKSPGDDKDMVLARRNFLNSGFYSGISDAVNKLLIKYSKDKTKIVDIGCGEGYYTSRAYDEIKSGNLEVDFYALDISKEAVVQGAKTYKGINWLVASAMEMPFEGKSMDIALAMFTKIFGDEYKRILKDKGILIVVSPNFNHLLELKEVVYDKVRLESYEPRQDLDENYKLLEHINVNYKRILEGNANIMNLFNMTPYRWRSPREGIERLKKVEALEISVDINIDIYTI